MIKLGEFVAFDRVIRTMYDDLKGPEANASDEDEVRWRNFLVNVKAGRRQNAVCFDLTVEAATVELVATLVWHIEEGLHPLHGVGKYDEGDTAFIDFCLPINP